MHTSIPIDNTMEIIDAVEISPLISHANVKVCYVGEDANRNRTVITKDVATEMGKKLPGSPIVGLFNKEKNDFEQHSREIVIEDGQLMVVDITKPYGFVPTDAKVWFQKFNDEGVEHEYLCTECYIWTGAYPESERIIKSGNNQSMELSDKISNGFWANEDNTGKRIFIYNEALIEKLCILGQNVEPCFEGAQIKSTFSLENDPAFAEFKKTMFSMMEELQETLSKGGKPVFTTYAVEIGDALWRVLYDYISAKYPAEEYCSAYSIEGIYEEGTQKFVILQGRGENKGLFRMNFTYSDEGFTADEELVEVTKSFTPSKQFAAEDVEKFELEYAKCKKDEDEKEEPEEKPEEEDEEKKKKYDLAEVTEYAELQAQFEELQTKYGQLEADNAALTEQVNNLTEFKVNAEKVEKQAMIDSFYMLSDEDKKDCVEHIDTYSVDDIEAKLSIICVRNKVSFNLDEEPENKDEKPAGMFNLSGLSDDDDAPEWIKAVRQTAANK